MASRPATQTAWLGLAFILLSFVVRLITATITSSELPALQSDFNISASAAELSLTLFLAIAGALVAPVGMIADRLGRVRVFTYGALGMAAASAVSALAPNYGVFLASRVAEAVAFPAAGAASLALVAKAFTDQRLRARVFGVYGACYGLALALSVVLGGFFATDISWRWGFAMNIPVLVVAVIGVRATLLREDDPHHGRQLDPVGTVLLLIIVSFVLVALDRGPVAGWAGLPAVLLAIGLVTAVLMVVVHRRRVASGDQVVFDPELFASPGYRPAWLVSFLMMFGAFAVFTVLPLYWSLLAQRNPIEVGIGMLPVGAGWSLGALAAIPVGHRIGARGAVLTGLVMAAAGLCATALVISPQTPDTATTGSLLLLGLGLGMAYARVNEAGLRHVADRLTGLGSGWLIGIRLLASGLGAVVLAQGLVLGATLEARGLLDGTELPAAERNDLKEALAQVARGRPGPLWDDEERAKLAAAAEQVAGDYDHATRATLLAAAGFVLAGAGAATRLAKPERQPQSGAPSAA